MSPEPAKERFGQVAVRRGYISERQVAAALDRQRALAHGGSPHKLIGMIMLEMGALGTTELIEVLRELNVPSSPTTERRSLN